MKLTREFVRDGETVAVKVEHLEGHRYRVLVGDKAYEYDARALGDGGVRLQQIAGSDASGGDAVGVAYGAGNRQRFMVRVDGHSHVLEAPASRRGGAGGAAADGTVRAPMTGTVLDVLCKVGDQVTADQTLVVVSAMKMEHKLTAGIAGVVQSVEAEKDGTVEQGAQLVVVTPDAKPEETGK